MGGGISNTFKKQSYIIPVTKHAKEDIVISKHVTPMSAEVDRAKSELKESIEEEKPHIPTDIKTQDDMKSVSMNQSAHVKTTTKRKRGNSQKPSNKKIVSKKRKLSKKRGQKQKKRKLVINSNIFSNKRSRT